jgi:host factor-I protein
MTLERSPAARFERSSPRVAQRFQGCHRSQPKTKSASAAEVRYPFEPGQTLRPAAPFVYNVHMSFRPPQANANAGKHGRTPPPQDTFEEAAFLKALGEKQKPVTIKLLDGQIVRGWIEYYDRNMVRLTRETAPNLFIYKHEIMYIAEDSGRRK